MKIMLIKTLHVEIGDREATCRGKCYLALNHAIDPYPECSNFLWELPSCIACGWPWQESVSSILHPPKRYPAGQA